MSDFQAKDAPDFIRAIKGAGGVAVFDADGCLWQGDICEDFIRYLLQRGEIPDIGFDRIMKLIETDITASCHEVLKFFRGISWPTMQHYVDAFWERESRPYNADVLSAMQHLHDEGIECWVVTASPTVIVEPFMRDFPANHVFGLELELATSQRITGNTVGTETIGEGKAIRIQEQHPEVVRFAVGNSTLDVAMLTLAEIPWAYEPDTVLQEAARTRGWTIKSKT